MQHLQRRVVKILDPPCPDRHLRVDHEDHFIKVHAPGLIFSQERCVLGPLGDAPPLEGIAAHCPGTSHHAFCGLADGLAQLLNGLLLGRGEVQFHARAALKGPPGVLAIDFVQRGDGLGDDGEVAAEGAQRLDAFGDDGHFPEPVEFVEHDHDRPGFIIPRLLGLQRGD